MNSALLSMSDRKALTLQVMGEQAEQDRQDAAPGEEIVVVEITDEELITEIDDILVGRIAIEDLDPKDLRTDPLAEVDANAMRFEMGREMIEQGYFYQARDIYSDLSMKGFREYESLVGLGIAHKMLGDISDAVNCLNRALELRTDYPDAWFQLGLLMMESERPMLNEAKAFLRKAYRLKPDDGSIVSNLQRCEMMLKGYTA